MRIAVFVLLALLSLLPAPPASAQDTPDKFVDQLPSMIDSGAFPQFVELMEPRRQLVVGALAMNPSKLRRTCDVVEGRWRSLLDEHPAPLASLCKALSEAVEKALAAKKDDADTQWSRGSSTLFAARIAQAQAGAAHPSPFCDAAESFRRSWEILPGDGAAGVRAVRAFEEAARIRDVPVVAGAPVLEPARSANELMEKLLKAHPQSGAVLGQSALSALARAQDPATKKSDAKAMVDQALVRLAPLASKKDADLDLATAWNELVSFQLAQKMGLKHALRTRAVRSGDDLEIQVPLSSRWRVEERGNEPVVRQSDADGALVRLFTFRRFKQEVNYAFKVGEASGGNITALAQHDFDDHKRSMSVVADAKEPAKGRVSARISSGVSWEVLGTSLKEKKEKRMRSWMFKSDEGRGLTFAFICDESKPQEMDPAARAVVDSLVELPAKK